MDKAKASQIRTAITGVFAAVEQKFGVKATVMGGNFSTTDCTYKVQFAEVASNGTVQTREAQEFVRNAELFGLKPDDLGTEFSSAGRRFKITGLSTRSRRFPILGQQTDTGKTFKFPAATVCKALGRKLPDL